jgi:hypothetical protein
MKRWQNIVIQLLGILGQSANVFSGIVSPKYQPLVMLALTMAQATAAYYAHSYNPDGTAATTAYIPPSKP